MIERPALIEDVASGVTAVAGCASAECFTSGIGDESRFSLAALSLDFPNMLLSLTRLRVDGRSIGQVTW